MEGSLTITSQVISENDSSRKGTFTHIPPEVFKNSERPPDYPEDVYAFAITLWEIFSGKSPYSKNKI